MSTTPTEWQRALALMDAALALPAAPRTAWLEQLERDEPAALPLLTKLLQAHDRVESQGLLATLPKVGGRDDDTDDDRDVAGLRIGPFELIEPLGRGGMGSVWRARHADGSLKRNVAVKLPRNSADPASLATLRERFARERDFLAQLEHPNIARLYDAGVSESGQPYLAMEYVAGQPIDAYCDAQRLPVKARLNLFLQVLDAVAYAHQQLVLHRDLKPGNVLVDAQRQVRLLDFGVARLLPPTDTRSPAPAGADRTDLTERAGAAFTLGYAAPEQITHGTLSTATDVYALGVMLYRLLTGLSPYQPERDTRGSLEDAVLLTAPAAPSARAYAPEALQARATSAAVLRRALRGDLDVVVGKALKKSAGERYASATALAEDLRRHLAQQPIAARPDSWAYRSRLFIARHRVSVIASALAALALIGTTGLAVWQARVGAESAARAAREAARANTAQQFFAGLLSKANPERNKDIKPIDRQMVDHALSTAERDFAADPQTLALILKQIGDVYVRLGVPAKELEVQKKRVAVIEGMPIIAADEWVDAHVDLGGSLQSSSVPEERAQSLPKLMDAYRFATSKPASADMVVKALCAIADYHIADFNYKDAQAYASEAVAKAQSSLPPQHPKLAWAYTQLAISAMKLGQFDTARTSFHNAMDIDAHGSARGLVEQVQARRYLADMEYLEGNYEAAAREASAALDFAADRLGGTDGTLVMLRLRAVLATERSGRADEAARMARILFQHDLVSDDPWRAGRAHFATGVVAMANGDAVAANQAFAAVEARLGSVPAWQWNLAVQRATLALRTGDSAQAFDILAKLLEQLRAAGKTDTDEFAKASERMGVVLSRLGRHAEAQTAFDAACLRGQKTLQARHPERVRCESYRILASTELDAVGKSKALEAQGELLTAGRVDRTALSPSLLAAAAWVKVRRAGASINSSFPLLN